MPFAKHQKSLIKDGMENDNTAFEKELNGHDEYQTVKSDMSGTSQIQGTNRANSKDEDVNLFQIIII